MLPLNYVSGELARWQNHAFASKLFISKSEPSTLLLTIFDLSLSGFYRIPPLVVHYPYLSIPDLFTLFLTLFDVRLSGYQYDSS